MTCEYQIASSIDEDEEIASAVHEELMTFVDHFESVVIGNVLRDTKRSQHDRKVIGEALCEILAKLTGAINISSLLCCTNVRDEMLSYFDI